MKDLLGREAELARLQDLVRATLAGRGGIVLLRGEMGIGKTSLLSRLAETARDQGAAVGFGRWYDSHRMPAYVGFSEALPQLCRDERVRAGLDMENPYVSDVSNLGPELSAALGLKSNETEGGDDSYRLWRGIEILLLSAAEQAPLLLVLDDLHWADAGSLELISYLAREIGGSRLLIAGAYRDDDVDAQAAITRVLTTLGRSEDFALIELSGLQSEDASVLARSIAGRDIDASLLHQLLELTRGNPLFLEELVRHLLSDDNSSAGRSGGLQHRQLPHGVQDAMARRLAAFSPECQYVLQLASCIDAEFDLTLLQLAGNIEQEQLARVLQEASDRSTIVEHAHGRLAFSHPMMREVVYQSIPAPNRMANHRRVAAALETFYGAEPMRHAREIAGHLVAAGSLADPHQVVVYCTEAVRQARALFAFDEAKQLSEAALAALDRLDTPLPRVRAQLLMQLAYTGTVGGRPDEAGALYREAIAILDQLSDGEGRTDAYRWLSSMYLHHGRWQEALGATCEGLATAQEAQTHAYLGLVGTHALAAMIHGKLEEAERWSQKLLDLSFDDETRAVAHHTFAGQCWGVVDGRDAMEHFAASRRLLLAQGRDPTAAQVALDHAVAAYFVGAFQESREAFDESRRLARATGRLSVTADLCAFEVMVCVHRGAWERAHESLEQWRALQSELGGNTIYQQLAHRAQALERFWRSGPPGVAELLPASGPLRNEPLLALLQVEADGASPRLAALAESLPRDGRGLFWLSHALPVAAASLLSCAPDLSTWAPALARYSGGLFDWQLVDLELGRIAAVSGDWAGAGEHFESAKRVCDAGGLRAFEGQVAFHHGVMLLRSGDRRRGVAMVEEAYASLSQLGLEYLAGKASAVLSRPSRGRPLTAGPGGLTEREYGVLRLVSEGYSVREIAEELVISERTVGNHLAKVYEKLGMRRSQAIAWFVHNRLEASEGEHEE